jgi:site-specific DNA-methyltransferase (adenine-specific)
MHEYLNKDCIEYLETLQDNSVDLILTDPPYFIGFDGGKDGTNNGIQIKII